MGRCGYHDSVVDSRKSTWAACVVKLTRCMLPSADIARLKSRSRVSIGSAPVVSSTIVISNVVSFSHTPDTSPMGADNLRSSIARGVYVCTRVRWRKSLVHRVWATVAYLTICSTNNDEFLNGMVVATLKWMSKRSPTPIPW